MPQNETEYQFSSIEETKTQEEAETFYKERGWDIIKPVQIKGKCDHEWAKVKERDYQCVKCNAGFIGVPDEA